METYKVFVNGIDAGSFKTVDIRAFVEKVYPGVSYEVNEEEHTVYLTVGIVKAMGISKTGEDRA